MGYHVKLEELHNTSSHIIDQTEAWIKQLSRVRASLLDIGHMDMHGEAADAIRAYIQEVHIKILDWIIDTIKTYRSSLILYVDGYRDIEPDPKGEISQGVLEEQLEQLQREKSEFLQIAENIEQIYRELSQYMDVDSFCAAGVENCYDNAIQFAEKVRTQVGEYEEVHRHDVDSIDEMISNIEHIMNLHSGGNSGRYSANGVLDIAGYQPGSMAKLPEYQKAANLNMLQRMYVEQAVERVKAGKSYLVSVSGGAEGTPNICVLPIHGVVIAKGVGIGDKEYYGAPISAQRCKISETVFLSAQSMLIGAGVIDGLEAGVSGALSRLQNEAQAKIKKIPEKICEVILNVLQEKSNDELELQQITFLSDEYMSWIKKAEGCSLTPFVDRNDNSTMKALKNVTIGIGFTFDKTGRNWDVLSEVTGWTDEEIANLINDLYCGNEIVDEQYFITMEQACNLFLMMTEHEYMPDVNAAINAFNEQNNCTTQYSQRELEAIFDYAYNNGLSPTEDTGYKYSSRINNPDKVIYYYLRKDQEGAVDAVKRFGTDDRRRLNQMNLFFYDYEFLDKKDEELDVLRDKLGF